MNILWLFEYKMSSHIYQHPYVRIKQRSVPGLSPILAEAERRGEAGRAMELLLTSRACASFQSYAQGVWGEGLKMVGFNRQKP